MKLLRKVNEFHGENETQAITQKSDRYNVITFSSDDIKRKICFELSGNDVCIDMVRYNPDNVNQFLLREGKHLSKSELLKMTVDFDFEVEPHHLLKDIFVGVIPNIGRDFGNTYFGCVAHNYDRYALIIFGKRGTTVFDDNVYYIHGIWEVELDELEKTIFFGKSIM